MFRNERNRFLLDKLLLEKLSAGTSLLFGPNQTISSLISGKSSLNFFTYSIHTQKIIFHIYPSFKRWGQSTGLDVTQHPGAERVKDFVQKPYSGSLVMLGLGLGLEPQLNPNQQPKALIS